MVWPYGDNKLTDSQVDALTRFPWLVLEAPPLSLPNELYVRGFRALRLEETLRRTRWILTASTSSDADRAAAVEFIDRLHAVAYHQRDLLDLAQMDLVHAVMTAAKTLRDVTPFSVDWAAGTAMGSFLSHHPEKIPESKIKESADGKPIPPTPEEIARLKEHRRMFGTAVRAWARTGGPKKIDGKKFEAGRWEAMRALANHLGLSPPQAAQLKRRWKEFQKEHVPNGRKNEP